MTEQPTYEGYTKHQPIHNHGDVTLLPGWPGYRNRPGRSGLDYIDTQIEMAHMTGVYIRKILSGSWLRPDAGQSPIATLIVAILFLMLMPGPAEACPAILIILMIGVVVTIRYRWRSSVNGTPDAEKRNETDEDGTQ